MELDVRRDLEQLRKLMIPMNLSNNERQELIALFSNMASNKETMYRETLRIHLGLSKLDTIADELMSNQELLHGMQDETRMIMQVLKD